MTDLKWRAENGKQPAVYLSDTSNKQRSELLQCHQQGHRVVRTGPVYPQMIVLETDHGVKDGFFLDFAGEETAIILAHWTSMNMADDAFESVTNRMQKLAFELREHRDRMQKVVPIGTIPATNATGPLGLTPEELNKVLKKPMQVLPLNDVEFEEPKASWDTPGRIVIKDNKIDVDFSAVGPRETPGFRSELRQLLNKHSKDAETGMPDFILASLMVGQLESLAEALKTSEEWKRS